MNKTTYLRVIRSAGIVGFALLSSGPIAFSQIIQEWSTENEEGVFSYYNAEMKLSGNSLFTKGRMFEGGSFEQAQRITTNGVIEWYDAYSSFNQCFNCGLHGVSDVAITNTGVIFSVGMQPASPFFGGYFGIQFPDGSYTLQNEVFNGSISREYYFIELSDDQTKLFVIGDDFEDSSNFSKLIYRFDTEGQVESSVVTELFSPDAFRIGLNDQLFVAEQNSNELILTSFNNSLGQEWVLNFIYPDNSSVSIEDDINLFSNGDILVTAELRDQGDGAPRLILLRITPSGEVVWEQLHELVATGESTVDLFDTAIGENDSFALQYRVTTGQSGPTFRSGGKGGDEVEELYVDYFGSNGTMQWRHTYTIESVDVEQVRGTGLFIDEEGHVLASFYEDFAPAGFKLLLIRNNGTVIDSFSDSQYDLDETNGLLYAGNQTFYMNVIGATPGEFTRDLWISQRYNYEIPELKDPCEGLSVTISGGGVYCEGTIVTLEAAGSYISAEWDGGVSGSALDVTEDGTYTVTATFAGNCILSIGAVVTFEPQLSSPTISVSGNLLTCDQSGFNYQWYLDFDEISGATNQSYEATETGTYQVEIDNAVCFAISDTTDVATIGLNELKQGSLHIYPNPASGQVILTAGEAIQSVRIYDMSLRLVQSVDVNSPTVLIDLNNKHFSPGVYGLMVTLEGGLPTWHQLVVR